MPPQLEGIDHVEVFVRDLDTSVRWYADVLGLKECSRWDPHPVMIGTGGTMLALFRQKQEPRASARADSHPDAAAAPTDAELPITVGWHRVAWRTNQAGFEAAQQHLKACGVEFHGPIDHEKAWSIYFCDPDGNPLEITYYV